METIQTDILIIGGGIAGSAIAAALKNTNFNITLVESRPKGTDLNRGDILYPTTLEILSRWGALSSIEQKGAIKHTKELIIDQTKPIFEVDYSKNKKFPYALSIDHVLIEDALLEFATSERLTIYRGYVATEMSKNDTQFLGAVITGKGETKRINARLVIGADGRNSKVRESIGITVKPFNYGKEFVVWCMPLKEQIPMIAHLYIKPGESLLTQVLPPGNRLRTSISTDKGKGHEWVAKSALEKMNYICSFSPQFPQVEPIFNGEHVYSLRSQNSPAYFKQNVVLVGDAAHEVHPLSSQGLQMAIADAYILARLLNNSLTNITEKLQKYEKIRRRHAQQVISRSHILAKILMTNYLGSKAILLCLSYFLKSFPIFKNLFSKELSEFEFQYLSQLPPLE